jgi:hypothetical protein
MRGSINTPEACTVLQRHTFHLDLCPRESTQHERKKKGRGEGLTGITTWLKMLLDWVAKSTTMVKRRAASVRGPMRGAKDV